jgi:hypothetical protein
MYNFLHTYWNYGNIQPQTGLHNQPHGIQKQIIQIRKQVRSQI